MIKSDGGDVGEPNLSNVKKKCHYQGSLHLRGPGYPKIIEKKGGVKRSTIIGISGSYLMI